MNFVTFERRALVPKKKKTFRTTFNLELCFMVTNDSFLWKESSRLTANNKKNFHVLNQMSPVKNLISIFCQKLSPKVDFLLKVLGIIPWDI